MRERTTDAMRRLMRAWQDGQLAVDELTAALARLRRDPTLLQSHQLVITTDRRAEFVKEEPCP